VGTSEGRKEIHGRVGIVDAEAGGNNIRLGRNSGECKTPLKDSKKG